MEENRQTPLIGKATRRKQHYVPCFFLEEFADDGGRFAVLRDGRVYENVRPQTVGFQKNLYETPVTPDARDGMMLDPNAIEKTLGDIENHLAHEYRRILEETVTMRPSDGNSERIDRICDISSLLVTFLIARSPEYLSKTVPEQRRSILEHMRQHGLGTPEDLARLLSETTGRTPATGYCCRNRLPTIWRSCSRSSRSLPVPSIHQP